jgi:uncharacterized membrane protein
MIHTIEKLSAAQAAAVALTPWLRVATLAVGLLTGLVSLATVMKLVQKRRDMRSRRA